MPDGSPYLHRPKRTEFEAKNGLPPHVPRLIPKSSGRIARRRISHFEIIFAAACFVFIAIGAMTALLT